MMKMTTEELARLTRRSDLVRRATPGDAPSLADVQVATWRVAYAVLLPGEFLASLDRDRRERWWRQFLERGGVAHVAETEDRLIGFCSPGASEDEGWGEIFSIYVLSEHWGEGHGTRLMEAGESTLRGLGFTRALLWVLRDNLSARRFYENRGWRLGRPFRVEEIGGVQLEELRYEIEL